MPSHKNRTRFPQSRDLKAFAPVFISEVFSRRTCCRERPGFLPPPRRKGRGRAPGRPRSLPENKTATPWVAACGPGPVGGAQRGEKSLSHKGRDFSAAIRGIAGVRLFLHGFPPQTAAQKRFPKRYSVFPPPESPPARQKNTVTVYPREKSLSSRQFAQEEGKNDENSADILCVFTIDFRALKLYTPKYPMTAGKRRKGDAP